MLEPRDNTNQTGTATPMTINGIVPPGPGSLLVVVVGLGATTPTVTGITAGTGTFVLAAAANSAGRRVEIWVGYNFGTSYPTSVVITRGAGTVNCAVVVRALDVFRSTITAPTITASTGNTGTSTSADSGSLTPTVGDVLVAAAVLASTTADSTARTHTGNSYQLNTGAELSTVRVESGFGEATAAAPSKEVWTLAASVEWASIQAKITLAAAPAPATALLIKGMSTQAADAASSY